MVALGPPPPGVDLSEDQRPVIIAVSVVTWVLALVAVGLRLVCRQMKAVDLWWDDWLIVASLFPAVAHVAAMAGYSVSRGVGQHIWAAPPDALYAWAIGLFIAELGYFLTLLCVKWSILLFYWRSFKIRQSIKVPIYILATIVGLWGISVILVTLLECQPINAWWERFNPEHPMHPSQYHCPVQPKKFFYGNAIPTIITDILMLVLPTPYIWSLQLPGAQKFALAGIFLVGLFVTVVSIVRLNYLLHVDLTGEDITWNFVDIGLWSIVEANVAIVCACLPFLRPIVQKVTFGFFHMSSNPSRRQQQSTTATTLKRSHAGKEAWDGGESGAKSSTHVRAYSREVTDEHPFVRLADDGARSEQSLGLKKSDSGSIELGDVSVGRTSPIDGILVTTEVHMQHQTA